MRNPIGQNHASRLALQMQYFSCSEFLQGNGEGCQGEGGTFEMRGKEGEERGVEKERGRDEGGCFFWGSRGGGVLNVCLGIEVPSWVTCSESIIEMHVAHPSS